MASDCLPIRQRNGAGHRAPFGGHRLRRWPSEKISPRIQARIYTPRANAHRRWPGLMSMLENEVAEPNEIRAMLRELVVPAFAGDGSRGGTATARRTAKRAR